MKIAVAAESDKAEPRVAGTPETVKKFIGLGAEVAVEPGAGVQSGIPDADYVAAGATVEKDAVKTADIVLRVRRPRETDHDRRRYRAHQNFAHDAVHPCRRKQHTSDRSEMTEATMACCAAVKPASLASVRPHCRASTIASSESIGMWDS